MASARRVESAGSASAARRRRGSGVTQARSRQIARGVSVRDEIAPGKQGRRQPCPLATQGGGGIEGSALGLMVGGYFLYPLDHQHKCLSYDFFEFSVLIVTCIWTEYYLTTLGAA